jgi:hypothetical protein
MNFESSRILDLFEANELNVSRLYKIYSKINLKNKNFWEKLAKEEIEHAIEIRDCYDGREDVFEENAFSRGTIKHVADFVRESIDKVKNQKISHLEAVETALRIEQSFIEKKCFEIFIPNQKKVKDVLRKLNKETEEHIERLRIELERIENKK